MGLASSKETEDVATKVHLKRSRSVKLIFGWVALKGKINVNISLPESSVSLRTIPLSSIEVTGTRKSNFISDGMIMFQLDVKTIE